MREAAASNPFSRSERQCSRGLVFAHRRAVRHRWRVPGLSEGWTRKRASKSGYVLEVVAFATASPTEPGEQIRLGRASNLEVRTVAGRLAEALGVDKDDVRLRGVVRHTGLEPASFALTGLGGKEATFTVSRLGDQVMVHCSNIRMTSTGEDHRITLSHLETSVIRLGEEGLLLALSGAIFENRLEMGRVIESRFSSATLGAQLGVRASESGVELAPSGAAITSPTWGHLKTRYR